MTEHSKILKLHPDALAVSDEAMIVTLSVGQLRDIVREEVAKATNGKTQSAKKEWLKAEELAEEYGLPKTWFEERGRAGDIARVKPGRYVLFKRRDVETYLDEHRRFEREDKGKEERP